MKAWLSDVAIGVRLAVGGGRTSLARFVLSAFGVALAVAVLLLAASVGPLLDAHEAHQNATEVDSTEIPGVAPTLVTRSSTQYHGDYIRVVYLQGRGPTSPVPPGVPRLPGPAEMFVSPELATMLQDPLLGLRFQRHVAGTIGQEGVAEPHAAIAYVGATDLPTDERSGTALAYRFGGHPGPGDPLDPGLLLLVLLGTVAVLVPVFIFLASSTRIAGAERDRRLAALRLVGAGNRQVRRIAAAETLVSALAGLLLGVGLFLGCRTFADDLRVLGTSAYPSDVVPTWWMGLLVLVAAPVIAVFAAQFALRRTIIEPLGVVRYSKPVRRRLLWRVALIAAGAAVLLFNNRSERSQLWSISVAAGVTLILLSVPAVLPWLIERVVGLMRGGPTSWQLAVRRLQLDSGTSARVVSGVAVVLAGAISLQALLLSQAAARELPADAVSQGDPALHVQVATRYAADAERALATASGTTAWSRIFSFAIARESPDLDVRGMGTEGIVAEVVDCGFAARYYGLRDCVDGTVYVNRQVMGHQLDPGTRMRVLDGPPDKEPVDWVVPAQVAPMPESTVQSPNRHSPVLVTRGVQVPLPQYDSAEYLALLDQRDPDAVERVRAALGPLAWRVFSYLQAPTMYRDDQLSYLAIRRGLLVGSVFTLGLAGLSLLVLAVEHIRERKRPLAVLAAGGVPNGVLARSLLWQIAVPIALGVVLAVGLGVLLTALVMRLVRSPMVIDWGGVLVLGGTATALVLAVSLLTMPFLRNATRLNSLRTE
ncbi:FtsX-like permease family protein [Actinokineospora enzanensis]|uniref:FtsX-like permease family protein n=1 Tax=Actinokineospora enzanensis TaxID=155975 RepID=UPI00037BE846|nr:FtsX-like permease family protein [Actinokineospora enzanensis]